MMIVNIFSTCLARQNDISMTCVCECHAQKGASAVNQSTASPLPKTTPTTNDSNQTPNLACTVSSVNQPVPPTGTLGPSHLVQPTKLQPQPSPALGLSSKQSNGGTTNMLAVGNPPSLLPSMLLSASSCNSLHNDSQSKVTTSKSVVDLLSSTSKSDGAKELCVVKTISEDSNKEAEISKTSSAICCSEVENCPSNEPSDTAEKMEASGACSNAQSSESCKMSESNGVAANLTTALVKEEGERIGGGAAETEKEVIVLDDDFKPPKKRFRTPAATSSDGPVSSLLML